MNAESTNGQPKQYGKLRPSEIVLGIIAGLMLLGWGFRWLGYGGPAETAPASGFPWFATFSIPSAVLVLVLIFLKLNCIELLPRKGQEKILPYVSLVPVLGFLIAELSSVQSFLTVGGAVALAYISATSYWRNYIPDFITNPLGTESEDGEKPKKTAAPAAPPPQEKAEASTATSPESESSGEPTPPADAEKERGGSGDASGGTAG